MAQTNRTFYSIKNKNKTNINFPLISQSTHFSNFYNNNRSSSQYNTNTNTNTTSNMNAFLERNYIPTNEKFNKSQDIFYAPSPELNSLYYTLKTYYDYVTKQTSAKAEEIADLNKEKVSFEKKIKEIEMGKEININSKEAISLVNPSEDPEQIIQKLNDLQEHKMQIQSEYTNESEYAVTIKHMTENVKAEIQKIDEEMLTIEQKLKDINVAKKVIKENKQVRKNEKTKGEALVNAIQNEIDKIHEIVIEQEFKKEKINAQTERKEQKVQRMKQEYIDEKEITKEEICKMKEDTIQNIREYLYKKEKKKQKENDYISFVFGLNFFQKNFIDPYLKGEEINTQKIKANPEYKLLFSSKQFQVVDSINNTNSATDVQQTQSSQKHHHHSKHKHETQQQQQHTQSEAPQTTTTTLTTTNHVNNSNNTKSKKNKKRLITLSELKQKFNEINLTFQQVYDLYVRITLDEKFTRKKMIKLNKKQTKLQTLKETYSKQVKDIIRKDYKNFSDLVKHNKRFEEFLQRNEPELLKAKLKRDKHIHKQLKKMLNENFNSHPDYKEVTQNSKKLITKTNDAKSLITYYLKSIAASITKAQNFSELDNQLLASEYEEKQTINNEDNNNNNSDNDVDSVDDNNTTNNNANKAIATQYQVSAIQPLEQYKTKTKETYINDILTYAKQHNITNSEYIYNTLFTLPNSNTYLKKFLMKDILSDKFIFYFYKDITKRKRTISIIEKILSYYSKYGDGNKQTTTKFTFKSSKSGNINQMVLTDDALGNTNITAQPVTKSTSVKKKVNDVLFPQTTKNKKSANQLLLYKGLFANTQQEKVKKPQQHKPTLQEEINNEYNYIASESEDDEEKDNYKRRPQTGTTVATKLSVTKRLYEPTLQKTQYVRGIKSGIQHIQKNTSENKEYEHDYERTRREVNEIGNYFFIYNDPKLNVNKLSNNTYRFIAQQMVDINEQHLQHKNKSKYHTEESM